MIKVHAFHNLNNLNWMAFVFQVGVRTSYTFNGECWEDGKPVLRQATSVKLDILGLQEFDADRSKPLLSIDMNNGETFGMAVDAYKTFVARSDYYLGVGDFPHLSAACAFGVDPRLRGWATRGLDFRRSHMVYDVPVRLERTGVHVGRKSGSNTSYLEEFGWVLDYSSGKLIEGVGTRNQKIMSS